MVNIEIRLIMFFAPKMDELYSAKKKKEKKRKKQDQKMTVAQIMNSLLPNSDLN